MEKDYSNKFNPFIPQPSVSFIDSRFTQLAYKCLYLPSLSKALFVSPNTKTEYGPSAYFSCKEFNHAKPEINCTCGLYSFKLLEDAWAYSLFKSNILVILVKITGEVIEHDLGYRSSVQNLLKVVIHKCQYKNCMEPATVFNLKPLVSPVCNNHRKKKTQPLESITNLGIGLSYI